jgi:hypothetical protein
MNLFLLFIFLHCEIITSNLALEWRGVIGGGGCFGDGVNDAGDAVADGDGDGVNDDVPDGVNDAGDADGDGVSIGDAGDAVGDGVNDAGFGDPDGVNDAGFGDPDVAGDTDVPDDDASLPAGNTGFDGGGGGIVLLGCVVLINKDPCPLICSPLLVIGGGGISNFGPDGTNF